MFATVLILSSILNDIQADTDTIIHDFSIVHETTEKYPLQLSPNSCRGMTVSRCAEYNPRKLQQCKICGLINNDGIDAREAKQYPLVVNGREVDPPYLYPWMVALLIGTTKICGGAIISENYILTAAHCVFKNVSTAESPDKFVPMHPDELKIGFLTRTHDVTPGSAIEEIILHPKYDYSQDNYDVTLLKLKESITCGIYKNPICLPPANFYPKENTIFNFTGWGSTSGKKLQETSKELQEGQGRIVSPSKCSNIKPQYAYCLMGVNKQSPCLGDSGGSMFVRRKRIYYSMGVASTVSPDPSTGNPCVPDQPFTYTSIPSVVQWISKITGLSPSK